MNGSKRLQMVKLVHDVDYYWISTLKIKEITMLRKLFLSIALFMVFSPAIAQVHVFVTDGTSTGNLGGLSGADETCTAAALAATPALTGTWTAWLSDSNTNAVDRILDAEYQLLDGTVVANDKADLTDGNLDAAINLDENVAVHDGFTWTGTQPDGTVTANTCSNWTEATDASQGTQGEPSTTGNVWTERGNVVDCGFIRSLYCFADVDISPPPVVAEPAIPTLGFFGLGILLVLLAGTGVFITRRRHS